MFHFDSNWDSKHSPQRFREEALYRYRKALEHGDFDAIAAILKLAENDSVLDQMIVELQLAGDATVQAELHSSDWHMFGRKPSLNDQPPTTDQSEEKMMNTTIQPAIELYEPTGNRHRNHRWVRVAAATLAIVFLGSLIVMIGKSRVSYLIALEATATLVQREKITAANIDKLVQLYEIPKDSKDAGGLVFSANSDMIAYTNSHKEVRLWSIATQQVLQSFKSEEDISYVISISPDGKSLATYNADRLLSWDIADGKQTHQYPSKNVVADDPSFDAGYSADGSTLFSLSCTQIGDGGCATYEISGWDVSTHEQKFVTKDVSGSSYVVQINPNTQMWINGYADGRIVLRDLVHNEPKLVPNFQGQIGRAHV